MSEAPDPNVEAIRQKLLARCHKGLHEYGVTTARTDLDTQAWLTHLQNELLDATVYIERLKQELGRGEELARLRELERRLPHTADRVAVAPADIVYHRDTGHRYVVKDGTWAEWDVPLDHRQEPRVGDGPFVRIGECVSSPDTMISRSAFVPAEELREQNE